jgi:CDP-ribitol ribitolphosphotransferase / teichoic acid ribitol-phosphate polymerase
MKTVLFCINPYAFGILKPLHDELKHQEHDVLWYVPPKLKPLFPFKKEINQTDSISDLYEYGGDAIFVPGNEVPHYLYGVKVQVFHGLAGEKKGHFRIRTYFDLYLTQGPYFTRRFEELARKFKDFKVTETGWCKLDPLYQNHPEYIQDRNELLKSKQKKNLILFAPTFSPSLTCAVEAKEQVFEIADHEDIFLIIKFHDLTNKQIIEDYKHLASTRTNVEIIEDRNILKYLIMSDMMISDTSSVVYEFLLLDKPVITINSKSPNISWRDIPNANLLHESFKAEISKDNFKDLRRNIIEEYHPYNDGKSSARMIKAVENYIESHGIPESRRLNIYRRYLMNKMFGSKPKRVQSTD